MLHMPCQTLGESGLHGAGLYRGLGRSCETAHALPLTHFATAACGPGSKPDSAETGRFVRLRCSLSATAIERVPIRVSAERLGRGWLHTGYVKGFRHAIPIQSSSRLGSTPAAGPHAGPHAPVNDDRPTADHQRPAAPNEAQGVARGRPAQRRSPRPCQVVAGDSPAGAKHPPVP